MKKIAERMKVDPEFFKKTMNELKAQNPPLHIFIQSNTDTFYLMAENGQLDNMMGKKDVSEKEEQDIKKVRRLCNKINSFVRWDFQRKTRGKRIAHREET